MTFLLADMAKNFENTVYVRYEQWDPNPQNADAQKDIFVQAVRDQLPPSVILVDASSPAQNKSQQLSNVVVARCLSCPLSTGWNSFVKGSTLTRPVNAYENLLEFQVRTKALSHTWKVSLKNNQSLVLARDRVKVVYQEGGMRIVTYGQAVSTGSYGDVLMVDMPLFNGAKRLIKASVIGPKKVAYVQE